MVIGRAHAPNPGEWVFEEPAEGGRSEWFQAYLAAAIICASLNHDEGHIFMPLIMSTSVAQDPVPSG
jgi:hypothetical protein